MVLREVKVRTYEHKGLRTIVLTLSEKTPMQKIHTANEATFYGKIQSQDLISVSNATLKNLIKPNLLCDQLLELFYRHPYHLLPPRVCPK